MFVCLCFGVTDKHIKSAVQQGCCSYRDVRESTRVGMQCGKCACVAKQLVREEIATLGTALNACCPPQSETVAIAAC